MTVCCCSQTTSRSPRCTRGTSSPSRRPCHRGRPRCTATARCRGRTPRGPARVTSAVPKPLCTAKLGPHGGLVPSGRACAAIPALLSPGLQTLQQLQSRAAGMRGFAAFACVAASRAGCAIGQSAVQRGHGRLSTAIIFYAAGDICTAQPPLSTLRQFALFTQRHQRA